MTTRDTLHNYIINGSSHGRTLVLRSNTGKLYTPEASAQDTATQAGKASPATLKEHAATDRRQAGPKNSHTAGRHPLRYQKSRSTTPKQPKAGSGATEGPQRAGSAARQ